MSRLFLVFKIDGQPFQIVISDSWFHGKKLFYWSASKILSVRVSRWWRVMCGKSSSLLFLRLWAISISSFLIVLKGMKRQRKCIEKNTRTKWVVSWEPSRFEYIKRSDELLFDWTLAKTVQRTQREIIKFYIIAQILNECELYNLGWFMKNNKSSGCCYM